MFLSESSSGYEFNNLIYEFNQLFILERILLSLASRQSFYFKMCPVMAKRKIGNNYYCDNKYNMHYYILSNICLFTIKNLIQRIRLTFELDMKESNEDKRRVIIRDHSSSRVYHTIDEALIKVLKVMILVTVI